MVAKPVEPVTRWIVRVFWGRHAERAAHEHADNADMHDRGLIIEWHRALGEWSKWELVTGQRVESPAKGVNKFDPDRPADVGCEPVRYTVQRATFTRLF